MELSQMDDTAILNTLFFIAGEEAKGNELTRQDEQDYLKLDRELSKRTRIS